MEKKRQEGREKSDREREGTEQTRRSFLKRSAGVLVYVAPLVETFDVDDAEGARSGRGGGKRRARGRVSPGGPPPPPPPQQTE